MICGALALMIACFFSGAAFYINFAEHPARLGLATPELLRQWIPSYKRGFILQATLAVVGGLLGVSAYFILGDWRWMAGALLLLANWPFTLVFIMPTNLKLMGTKPENANNATRSLLILWGKLHFVRTCLGICASGVLLWAIVRALP